MANNEYNEYKKKNNKDRKDCWNKDRKDCGPGKDEGFFSRFSQGNYKFSIFYFLIVFFILSLINTLFIRTPEQEIGFSRFKELIRDGVIAEVTITNSYYYGMPPEADQDRVTTYRTVPVEDNHFIDFLDEHNVEYAARDERAQQFFSLILQWLIPIGIIILVWRYLFKRMGGMGSGVMSFGQNKAKIVAESDTDTEFDDVAGVDEAKDELVEVVDFLKNPTRYTAIGGKIPKGVLLVGPPGTGKTLLARAVAGEAGVTFFRMNGADFVEMFVGVGAARVRDLFKQAREQAPCIIFIDELDAIGKSRSNVGSSNDEREQTLNQLLVEMDGFDATSGVILLAATNRPEYLDPALLRTGRFDRQVLVDKPDLSGREAILKIHAQNVKLDESADLKDIARSTPGFVGSDLANIINEAALLAVRSGREKILPKDLYEAIEKNVAGLQKKNRLINKKERNIVAYHETGHALIAALTPGADPVQKISIVPRGFGALGYTLQMPVEDRYLMTQEELLGRIDVMLGGRAAEQLTFNQISTGAANDLVKSTDIAKNMITEYGMSERFRNVVLQKKSHSYLGNELGSSREYSEHTQQYVDEEVVAIIKARYEHVNELLQKHRDLLEKIAQKLLELEIIEEDDFLAMVKSAGVQLEWSSEEAEKDTKEPKKE